jgi:hypothetical protein
MELLNVWARVIDLNAYAYMVLLKIGREYREVFKSNKNIAFPFWKDAVAGGHHDDFLFSMSLVPRTKKGDPAR